MAVYGRKVSRFNGPLSLLSKEDLVDKCEPCSMIGQPMKAYGFCEDCQEYLCESCLSYHQRAKVSKQHQIRQLDSKGDHSVSTCTLQPEVCNEICSEHSHKLIEFFCPAHEALGCSVCIVLNHRSCDVVYIPDTCTDIGESEEYKQLMRKLTLDLNDLDDVIKQATDRDQEYLHDMLTKEIVEFRREIDDHLDKLQHKIQAEVDKIKTVNKAIAAEVIQNCESISSDVSQLQARLQSKQSLKQNLQLYIEIKKAKTKMRTNEVQNVVDDLEGTDRQYIFERNKDIMNMLANADVFGQIRLLTRPAFPQKKQTPENSTDKEWNLFHRKGNLFHKEDINVRTRSDTHCCNIAGCAALTSNKLLLADYNNEKLKIVDTARKTVLKEKILDSAPFDLAVLPEYQIAVSLPMKKEILIIAADDHMSNVRRFSVKGRCRGLLNHQNNIFVVCKDPSKVAIFDLLGNLTRTISLTNEIFQEPFYIVYNEESRLIFLSTGRIKNDSIVGITLQGEISVIYKQNDVVYPSGLLVLDDGSLLTCCFSNSGTIHHISKDLKRSHSKYSYIQFPHCICFDLSRDRIYIGCGTDQLNVFTLD